ncbi:MAG: hypothetical protein GY803_09595, partial [Chloroflexi bacterium]|nr:hypothetical protein [Chloroflexota bacterium]
NMLPPKKTGNTDSVGLTISTGGATLALAVLSDLALTGRDLSGYWFIGLLVFVSALMVSKIAFPSFMWVFSERRKNVVILSLFGVSLVITTFFPAWFFWNNTYLGISLARAGYKRLS